MRINSVKNFIKPQVKRCLARIAKSRRLKPVLSSDTFITVLDNVFSPRTFAMKKVGKNLYRGTQVELREIDKIAKKGINLVINLKFELPKTHKKLKKKYIEKGIKYINMPLNPFKLDMKQIENIFKVLKENLDKKMYIHCCFGKDRTGLVVGMYEKLLGNFNFMKVWDNLIKNGHREDIFPEVKKALLKFNSK